jgi:hypothetical protein
MYGRSDVADFPTKALRFNPAASHFRHARRDRLPVDRQMHPSEDAPVRIQHFISRDLFFSDRPFNLNPVALLQVSHDSFSLGSGGVFRLTGSPPKKCS